jgi:hypothetical protein
LIALKQLVSRVRRRDPSRGQSIVEFALILPLLLIMFLAVADFARIYSSMLTIESAAREAADFGAFKSSNWDGDPLDPASNHSKTLIQMQERACIAARTLPDYVGPDTGCVNPIMTVELQEADGSPGVNCGDETRTVPCRVFVTLSYDFHLISPLSINAFGVHVGFPDTISFERTSIFAISDFKLDIDP